MVRARQESGSRRAAGLSLGKRETEAGGWTRSELSSTAWRRLMVEQSWGLWFLGGWTGARREGGGQVNRAEVEGLLDEGC